MKRNAEIHCPRCKRKLEVVATITGEQTMTARIARCPHCGYGRPKSNRGVAAQRSRAT